jgi:hypothetical protein
MRSSQRSPRPPDAVAASTAASITRQATCKIVVVVRRPRRSSSTRSQGRSLLLKRCRCRVRFKLLHVLHQEPDVASTLKIASPNLLNDQAVYPPAVPHGTVGSGIRASESGFRVRGGRRFPRSTGAHRRGIVFYRRAVEAAAVEAAAALADLGTRRVLAVSGSV